MSKIYSYAEFQKVAKVGMRVRAVEGKLNACDELAGGKIQLITEIETDDDGFYINGCKHWGSTDGFLELLDDEPEQPERGEITWETLKIGDELAWTMLNNQKLCVMDIGIARKVIVVCRKDDKTWITTTTMDVAGRVFTIIQPTKLETISLADAEKALGKRIIIKE